MFTKLWDDIKKIARLVWVGIKWVAKQLWSAVSDPQWDLDVYRVGGLASYVVAGHIALVVANLLPTLDATRLGIGAGLASAVAGIGTTLFAQARKADTTLYTGK